ncbi:pseudouridine-5'-phosphate glycosidase, partial [Roseiarcus sp.]|uniref:pseudouridine-5'-phosphate glycosidase n=1 Tax=Roseiarcus sp. TaxID=1969460 RepID=UPI003D10CF43
MSAVDLLDFSPEVAEALSAKKPIVALESTIITHGMAYPRNVETARSVEEAAREMGAVPATIAVIDGRFRVGLNGQEIERLGELTGGVVKASRRDLALVAARKGSAGTTVAATMFIASLAGLEVFATGGIGGVHRGAEETFDISADLVELARTRVAVVCAGAKSILDIAKTLEFLETQGVAIVGYRCDEFPAFYARSSGFKLEHRCDGLHDLARMIRLQRDIGPGRSRPHDPPPARHRPRRPADRKPDPPRSRARAGGDRRADRGSGGGSEGARGGQKGGDPVPAQARGRTDRGQEPRGQYRAHQEQRHARRAGGGGAGEVVKRR